MGFYPPRRALRRFPLRRLPKRALHTHIRPTPHAPFLHAATLIKLTGQLEGVYAWIAANYAAGKLASHGDPLETIGVLEMGGASMQATFVPGVSVPREFEYSLELAGRTYELYTHSFLVGEWGAASSTPRACC